MLYSSARSLGVRTFIINGDVLAFLYYEVEDLKNLHASEIFEIFFSKDWESKIWLIGYRHYLKETHGYNFPNFLESYININIEKFKRIREYLLKTIENLTACSLTGQEVKLLKQINSNTFLFRIKPRYTVCELKFAPGI